MTGLLRKKRKCGHRDRHTGKIPREDEGRGQSEVSISQRVPTNHQKLEENMEQIVSQSLSRNQTG